MKKRETFAERQDRQALEREEDRIAAQRNLFAVLPVWSSLDRLKEGMLQRAYDLLSDGNYEACDAITEFLPSRDVEQMIDAWLDDQDEGSMKSRWYINSTPG